MKQNAISVENLNFSYKNNLFEMKDFSLTIKKGSFVCIAGANGSGKTTLAKLIDGLLVPQSGSIKIFGKLLEQSEDSLYEARKKLAFVFQNSENRFVFSVVEEEVSFAPGNLGIEREKLRQLTEKALKTVNLQFYKKHNINSLTYSQKQKLNLASALSIQPDCLIIDEAINDELFCIIKKIAKKKNLTIIFITHNMEMALQAQRLIVLKDGKIVLDDCPYKVFQHEKIITSCNLELPPVLKAAKQLRKRGFEIPSYILTEKELIKYLINKKRNSK